MPRAAKSQKTSTALVPVPTIPPLADDPRTSVEHDPLRRSDVDEWGRSEHMRALVRKVYDPIYRDWFRVEWEGFDQHPHRAAARCWSRTTPARSRPTPRRSCTASRRELRSAGVRPGRPLLQHPAGGRHALGPQSAASSPTPTTPTACCASSSSSPSCSPRAPRAPRKTYRERYRLRRFGRGGFVEIAMRAGVPVVPIAVVGAEESMPILSKVPAAGQGARRPLLPHHRQHGARPRPRAACIGRVLPGEVQDPGARAGHFDVEPDQPRYSRSRIMDESEAIRQQIQDALYDMLRHRRSVWFG